MMYNNGKDLLERLNWADKYTDKDLKSIFALIKDEYIKNWLIEKAGKSLCEGFFIETHEVDSYIRAIQALKKAESDYKKGSVPVKKNENEITLLEFFGCNIEELTIVVNTLASNMKKSLQAMAGDDLSGKFVLTREIKMTLNRIIKPVIDRELRAIRMYGVPKNQITEEIDISLPTLSEMCHCSNEDLVKVMLNFGSEMQQRIFNIFGSDFSKKPIIDESNSEVFTDLVSLISKAVNTLNTSGVVLGVSIERLSGDIDRYNNIKVPESPKSKHKVKKDNFN